MRLDPREPGLRAVVSYDPAEDVAAPYVATGRRPRVAILREQGVNGQVEMAAAFHRAGFACVDVHMTDLLAGRASLADFEGFVRAAAFPSATCSARGRDGPSRSCSTRAHATSSRPSSRGRTPLRSACATAVRCSRR